MSLTDKIRLGMFALNISLTSLLGCATQNLDKIPEQQIRVIPSVPTAELQGPRLRSYQCASYKNIEKVLNVENSKRVWNLKGCYAALDTTVETLYTLAGIIDGTAQVERTEKGYKINGFYEAHMSSPQGTTFEGLIKKADGNGDKIISELEIGTLAHGILNRATR